LALDHRALGPAEFGAHSLQGLSDRNSAVIGHTLGHYRILERIGTGGFATVYRAEDTETEEAVALKVLHQQYAEDEQFVERFKREAETIQALPENAHLVKPKEYRVEEGTHYLAMEYLAGTDLSQVLAERKRLTIDEALGIAAQVARALQCAHQGGVVHRDIKPQNIRITPQRVVKVLDFGIARATEGTKLTQTGAFIGTPQYMAPEIWEGKPADRRSDVYSLGIVLYEMVTGEVPFKGDTYAAVMRQHLRDRPRPPSTWRAETPRQVDWIVAHCLEKDAGERYQSSAQLLNDLQNWQQVRPYAQRPAEAPEPRTGTPTPTVTRPTQPQVGSVLQSAGAQLSTALSRFSQVLSRSPQAYLVGRRGAGAGYRFSLARKDTLLGRATNNSIVLNDGYLSPHHARIITTGGHHVLYDMRSQNGTYVNGYRVRQPVRLSHGDRIEIGDCEFTFHRVQRPRLAGSVSRTGRINQNDRLAAAISHASVIAIPVILALVVWATYKDRSRFVEFQAKQAIVYQLLFVLVLFLHQFTFLSLFPLMLLWLAASAYGCYAAYQSYLAYNFEYPIVTDLAQRWR
jgi:serine/threonine protein kinase